MPFFGCCTADSQTDVGRHQLYNNGSLVLFSTPWIRNNLKYQGEAVVEPVVGDGAADAGTDDGKWNFENRYFLQ